MAILFGKYVSYIRLWCIRSCVSHALDFLSGMFDGGHLHVTVQVTVKYVQ